MKNKLSIWAALIVLANLVNAADAESHLDVNMTGSKTFKLVMNNLIGDVKLSLKGEKNQIIYERTLTNDGSLTKSFDMSLFSDGNYEIELIDDQKIQSFPIEIKNDLLAIHLDEKETHFLPVVSQKNRLVSVNMLALEGEDLSVKIFNSADEVVYDETLRGKRNLGQIYDFSKTVDGKYTFQLVSSGRTTIKEILID